MPIRMITLRRWCVHSLLVGCGLFSTQALQAETAKFVLLAELDVGRNPHQISFTPDGKTALIACSGSNRVTRVDVESLRVIDQRRVPDAPLGVVPVGKGMVVARFGSDRLTRYQWDTVLERGHLVTGGAPSLLMGPVAPNQYLVSSEKADRLWLVDVERFALLQSHATGRRPFPASSDGRFAFVPNYGGGSVTVIDLVERRTVGTVSVGRQPSGGAMWSAEEYVVAVRGEDRLAFLSARSLQPVGELTEGIGASPFSVVMQPDRSLAYVNNTASHDISVVRVEDRKVLGRLPVGEIPIVMAVHPSGRTLWVSSEGSHTLSVIEVPSQSPMSYEAVALDRSQVRPRAGDEVAMKRLEDAARREVVRLHQFFEEWLRGTIENSPEELRRFSRALAPDFQIVSPAGQMTTRAELIEAVRAGYGRFAREDFRIWVDQVMGRALSDGLILVTYQEWQQLPSGKRGRLSSAVLRRSATNGFGVEWLHVHETWLPQ